MVIVACSVSIVFAENLVDRLRGNKSAIRFLSDGRILKRLIRCANR